jgi:molybdenum cofactor synthesis domain-containing protein
MRPATYRTGVSEDTTDGLATFGRRSPLSAAVAALEALVSPHGRTETLPVRDADGRVLGRPVEARRNVPGYRRAAMDGFAVRAADTAGADGTPVRLRRVPRRETASEGSATDGPTDGFRVGPGEAAPVHTGSEVPPGADAVVRVERTRPVDDPDDTHVVAGGNGGDGNVDDGAALQDRHSVTDEGDRSGHGADHHDHDPSHDHDHDHHHDEGHDGDGGDSEHATDELARPETPVIEVTTAVETGANVSPPDEDVAAGTVIFPAGRRLRASDLALCRSVGVGSIEVAARPRVSVLPTGEELVPPGTDPGPGEVVETNGLTVARLVERWGGAASYRDVVTDDPAALRTALERDGDHDLIVTTGGSSVGDRDLTPDAVADLGDLRVHDVAIKPGHPVAVGAVDGTPAVCLPGYPVSCLVTAVQFVRPAVAWAAGRDPAPHPSTPARLTAPIDSSQGTRTFVQVRPRDPSVADGASPGSTNEGDVPDVERVPAAGASVLSSVAAATGWVTVPDDRDRLPAGERVAVERWEPPP